MSVQIIRGNVSNVVVVAEIIIVQEISPELTKMATGTATMWTSIAGHMEPVVTLVRIAPDQLRATRKMQLSRIKWAAVKLSANMHQRMNEGVGQQCNHKRTTNGLK